MVIIESERLILRELDMSDETALAAVWGDAEVMKRCGGALSADIIRKVIRINRENCRMHGYAVFAVVQKSDGALIGAAGCKPDADNPRRAELIYHFGQAYWGRGYASEAVSAYLQWASDSHCMDDIFASALSDNTASIRILEKNGFVQNSFVQYEDTGFVPEPFYERHLKNSDPAGS
jgi:RimJ/RimL family protein N-acetyltransferase